MKQKSTTLKYRVKLTISAISNSLLRFEMDYAKKYFCILHPATDEDRLVSGPSSGDWSGGY